MEMDLWNQEDVDLLAHGFIGIEPDHMGSLGLIAVQGGIDWRDATRDRRLGLEFSREGFSECDPATGRGWAVVGEEGSLRGHVIFRLGDDSGFRTERTRKAP